MHVNLYALFESRFPKKRDETFLQLKDGEGFCYADLERYSSQIANRIVNNGVRPGDRVMVQVEKSPLAVFLYLACLKAGVIYIPLNTAYRADELEYLYHDAEPRLVVCSPQSPFLDETFDFLPSTNVLTLDSAGDGTLSDSLDAVSAEFETVEPDADAIAAILYTSGTTGKPKGAMLTHANLASNALALHSLWGFRTDDVLLHVLPIFHTHGLFVGINTTVLNGSKMIFLPGFNTRDIIKSLPRATVMMGVPTFYSRLLRDSRFDRSQCAHMRLFISGSAPLTNKTFTAFQARTGFAILERYGMTETNMITSNPLNGGRVAGSVGKPLSGVQIRICGQGGCIINQGEIGDIEVRGPNVFQGYWRNPDKTLTEFRDDGFFKTGDLGYIDESGYLYIVGRSKDLIISGGFNVYPKEIESVLNRIDGVNESAVIGVPHRDYGEGVIAVVVGDRPNAGYFLVDDIICEAKQHLAGYKVPKKVYFLDELPRNAMGKVEKARLREIHRDAFADMG